jgi:glycosyltransferase involved in cell wall biosynthesis
MERQLVEIIRALRTTNYQAYLAVLNKKGPLAETVEPFLSAPVFYLDRRKGQFIRTIRRLFVFMHETKIDRVYVQDTFSSFYAIPVCKLKGVKLINGSIRHAGVSEGLTFQIDKLLLAFSDRIIANSQAGLDFYGFKGHVIYNFVDQDRFTRTKSPLTRVVMNANFSNYKDHLTLLFAAYRLIKEGIITHLGLIGDGLHRGFCQRLCYTLGINNQVVFFGHVQNVEELLVEYGVGILCSTIRYKEGISNSILEYMGSGLIAIGARVGAVPEIIQDGYNGFLFQAENINSLCEVITRVVNEEEDLQAIRENAYQTLKSQFDPTINSQKLIDIFESA